MSTAEKSTKAPVRVRLRYFRPSAAPVRDPVRAWIMSRALRVALHLGFVVVVIGRCRCGKTYLLERTTPGRLIGGLDMQAAAGFKPVPFDSVDLPDAHFSIDESQTFEPESLANALSAMSGRAFAIATQSHDHLPAIVRAIGARRILLVEFEQPWATSSAAQIHG